MIVIIDYGMGNLRSVQKALEHVGANARITHSAEEISKADKIVLPGVGAMQPAMDKLELLNLIPVIKESVERGKPFLGICLGLQLLFDSSTEGGETKGLGLVSGTVHKFDQLKVPQMGWNQIKPLNSPKLFNNIDDNASVYFCHSYFVKPDNEDVTSAVTDYGVTFTSAIENKNLFGVQFHPEKSQSVGLSILKNFTGVNS